jgi:hypothetical protein
MMVLGARSTDTAQQTIPMDGTSKADEAMTKLRSSSVPAPLGSDSDLARLIDTEQQLATRLEAARSECTAIVARARAATAQAEAQLPADVATEVARVADRLERETARRIAAIRQDATGRAARYAAATENAEVMARALIDWMLAPDGRAR